MSFSCFKDHSASHLQVLGAAEHPYLVISSDVWHPVETSATAATEGLHSTSQCWGTAPLLEHRPVPVQYIQYNTVQYRTVQYINTVPVGDHPRGAVAVPGPALGGGAGAGARARLAAVARAPQRWVDNCVSRPWWWRCLQTWANREHRNKDQHSNYHFYDVTNSLWVSTCLNQLTQLPSINCIDIW